MAGLFGSNRKRSTGADAQRVAAEALAAAKALNLPEMAPQMRTGGLFGARATSAAPQGPAPSSASPAPQAAAAPDGWKPNKLDTIWNVLAGYSPNQGRQMQVDDHAQRMAAQQAAQQQAELISRLSPEERDLYMTDPKRWAELRMNQQAPYTLSQGAGRYGPGGQLQAYAPEVGVDGGYAYSSAPDGSVAWGGQRGPSHAEAETGRHNQRTEQIGQGQLGVSQGRLGLGWAAHNARLSGKGGYGTPGVGAGAIPDDVVEIDP